MKLLRFEQGRFTSAENELGRYATLPLEAIPDAAGYTPYEALPEADFDGEVNQLRVWANDADGSLLVYFRYDGLDYLIYCPHLFEVFTLLNDHIFRNVTEKESWRDDSDS